MNHGDRGFEPFLLPEVDRLPELFQLRRDQRLQCIEAPLLVGVVGRELSEVLDVGVDAPDGGAVRIEVALRSREEVPPLAGLGILQGGQHAFEVGEHRVRMRHLMARLDEPARAPVRDQADRDQDRQRHRKARPDLPSDRPAHLTSSLTRILGSRARASASRTAIVSAVTPRISGAPLLGTTGGGAISSVPTRMLPAVESAAIPK